MHGSDRTVLFCMSNIAQLINGSSIKCYLLNVERLI